jgi:pectate lyase
MQGAQGIQGIQGVQGLQGAIAIQGATAPVTYSLNTVGLNYGDGLALQSTSLIVDQSTISRNIISYVADSTNARTVASSTDLYKTVVMSFSGAITVTVPSDSSDPGWAIGTYVNIRVTGNAGQVTVVAGSGATLIATDAQYKTRVRYSEIVLEKASSDTWLIAGDTTA